MGLFIAALGALVVLSVVLLVVDVDISQTRRIERQVERENRRIRAKIVRGWSTERIAGRYRSVTPHHIEQIRAHMARSVAVNQEIQLLKSMWMGTGTDYEG